MARSEVAQDRLERKRKAKGNVVYGKCYFPAELPAGSEYRDERKEDVLLILVRKRDLACGHQRAIAAGQAQETRQSIPISRDQGTNA